MVAINDNCSDQSNVAKDNEAKSWGKCLGYYEGKKSSFKNHEHINITNCIHIEMKD